MNQSQQNFYDFTFGFRGVVTLPSEAIPASKAAVAIATLPQNKLLMVTTGDSVAKVVKLNNDGTPDLSFGHQGSVDVPMTSIGYFSTTSLELLLDGGWIICGHTINTVAVVRQLKDGTPDTSFGPKNDGQVSYNIYDFLDSKTYPDASFYFGNTSERFVSSTDYSGGVRGVTTTPDDKIALSSTLRVGQNDFRTIVILLNKDGSLDDEFGGKGYVFIASADLEARFSLGSLLQQDGKVLVFFQYNQHTQVIRYDRDGSVDLSYGGEGTGIVVIPTHFRFNRLVSMALKPDGGVIAVGDAYVSDKHTLLVSLTLDGRFDKNFNNGQPAISDYPGYRINFARSLTLQSDGKIVVGVEVYGGDDGNTLINLVARHLADGSSDKTFGGGNGFIAFDAIEGFLTSIAVLPDDRVVFSGRGDSSSGRAGHVVRCLG